MFPPQRSVGFRGKSSQRSGNPAKILFGLFVFLVLVVVGVNMGLTRAQQSHAPLRNDAHQFEHDSIVSSIKKSAVHKSVETKAPPQSVVASSNYYYDLLDPMDTFHSLSRRNAGYSQLSFETMSRVMHLYAHWHTATVAADNRAAAGSPLTGKYLIIKPAAQLCNRLRAHMGAVFMGIILKRAVFLDIATDNYAARLNGVFKNPGFVWELHKMPEALRSRLKGASQKTLSFPYEAVGGHQNIVCKDWFEDNGAIVWNVNSHAGFLPLIARNAATISSVLANWTAAAQSTEDFSGLLLSVFHTKVGGSKVRDANGAVHSVRSQVDFERLEVLMARILYQPEKDVQKRVDSLIRDSYAKAQKWYAANDIQFETGTMPPVVGIHLRSEYLLSMNSEKSRRGGIKNMQAEYEWFAECGNLAVHKTVYNKPFFIFIAADTREAQLFAETVWGKERVMYQPFENTGKTLDGIKDAVVDLVTVASFDTLVTTPHSSYSEMASLLGQPRSVGTTASTQRWLESPLSAADWSQMAVNRPMQPMMTKTKWEIQKLNKYLSGRALDIDLDNGRDASKWLFPKAKAQGIDFYTSKRVCKLQVAAGIGWMGMWPMFKDLQCYDPQWHNPGDFFA